MVDVSVIIPAYNADAYLARSIRSAINNVTTYSFEVVVVNDGSTDDTQIIINSFGQMIKALDLQTNKGLSTALNVALDASSGKYVVRIDADDYVNENYIHILATYLDMNDNASAVRCDYYKVSEDEVIIDRFSQTADPIGCAIMFRRKVMFGLGCYDIAKKIDEEKSLLRRFYKANLEMHDLNFPLYRYRNTIGSLSKKRR